MNAPESPSPSRPRRRRWFQYSLRTLLLVVTVAAVLLGIWTGRARRQKEAVEAIRELGGYVGYSSADGDAPGPDWLRKWLGIDYFDSVVCVYVVGDGFTDDDLEQLQSLRGLKSLCLLAPNITDAGLEHVGHLHDLKILWLGGPGITDAGFAHLKHLRMLTRLTIERGAVVDRDSRPGAPATGPDATHRGATVDREVMMRCSHALHEPTAMKFRETPLKDVCEYLATMHGIKVEIAADVAQDARSHGDYPITCTMKGVSLGTALDSLLPPLGLDWAMGREGLIITTKGRATRTTQVTAVAMETFRDLPSLQTLEVRAPEFASRGWEHLEGLTQLQELDLEGIPLTDAGLAHLAGLVRLRDLNLSSTRLTDAGLEHLEGLVQLQSLHLHHTQITGAGLRHLGRLTQLRNLHLQLTPVVDAELKHLEGLTGLRSLDLSETPIGDAGLEHLKGLTQLEDLILFGTKVTDAGLKDLMEMTRLNRLVLIATPVTNQGIKDLQKALPRCRINR
ncbi:MAG: hypothetical protein NTW96_01400 [Planctomycetia bacterium]|nr:hypothetical protein [Planctomycetia bacterium]